MTQEEYAFRASEIEQLTSLLEQVPPEKAISRVGLETRLKAARAAIANLPPRALRKAARLTFRGRPVFGSHGVAAEFGARAAQYFTEAYSAVAAGLASELRFSGPIPDKDKHQLLITGTALGSFGFEFELPSAEEEPVAQAEFFPRPHGPEIAMEKLEALFESAAIGDDDQLAELVEDVHPRAVKKAAEFLSYIAQEDAWCGLQFQDRTFRFSSAQQVRVSAERLHPNNIRERDELIAGEFQGVLPSARTFEFKRHDTSAILRGKIGPEITDPDELNRQHLHKPLTATFHIIEVGQGRPRFSLRVLTDIA